MSFTTRCPACGTVFRVVADQLKISDGWVRCGHCADVFDATVHLQAWVPPPAERAAAATAAPAAAAVPAPAAAMAAAEPDPEPDESSIETRAPEGEPDPWAAPASPAIAPDFETELQQFASAQSRAAATPAAVVVPPPGLVAESPPDPVEPPASPMANAVATDVPSEPAPAEAVEPGFMRQARRRAFWSSPGVRAALALCTVLLAVLLAAQWAVHERHRLIAAQPVLKPWLQQACDLLGCSIAPPRRIEAIVIDSSTLVRRLGNFYSFDFVVRNTAATDVAVPALELSLTDSRDAVVARRVFLPQEWPGAPAHLAAHGTLPVSLRLSLSLGESAPMAGYRALVFYP